MSRRDEDVPIEGDETEPLEEGQGQEATADVPIKGDATEALPLSQDVADTGLRLADE